MLCSCKQPYPADGRERKLLNVNGEQDVLIQRATGCSVCKSGYLGRTGIYELVAVTDHMRGMIHDGASEQQLERYARTLSPGIRDDGRRKVLEGVTTLEEVLRVTRED